MLLARVLARQGGLRVLDLMAGCGIRSLRYGLEGGATQVWANDADGERLAVLAANLAAMPAGIALPPTALTAQRLLAALVAAGEHRELVDLDAFGSPLALLPAALEVVALGGCSIWPAPMGAAPPATTGPRPCVASALPPEPIPPAGRWR